MKRLIALCLTAACLISLVGCAGDTNMDEKKPNNTASAYALALASYPEMAPYILEFYTDKCAYSYKVDAVSGDIIGKKTDWFSRQESETVPTERQKPDSKQRTDD